MPLNVATEAARLSCAPMMDWTDRHCRMFHRQFSRRVLLYTEMVTSAALVRGGALHLLDHEDAEQPVALQLGGSDPVEMATAARMGAEAGYDEINVNCGCPSDRVQSGSFGAVLMERPELVAEICSEMIAAQPREVTVKCRIGVDEQDPGDILPRFLTAIREAGVRRVTIHARKAWLQGLSPRENREIPPLDYDIVHRMKSAFPDLHVSLNGGVDDLADARAHLDAGLDGVMIGRAAYHEPAKILSGADAAIWGDAVAPVAADEAVRAMESHVAVHLSAGGRLHQVTRHMLGAFAGRPGARAWRRHLSEAATDPGADWRVVEAALSHVTRQAA